MLDTPEAVLEAMRENHERPHGLQRTVTAEELVEAAEPFDKPDVLVTALLELMTAYEYTGEHRKSPVVFARLLKLWDTTPESFSQWEAHQVFWRFKWVATSLLQVPEVPLATVDSWIDRTRTRYEEAEHDLQPVAALRYHVARHTGTGIPDAYDLWVTRSRTELSDCEACETRHVAWHQVAAGEDEAALDTWRPVLDGSTVCTEEPQMSQARALLPLLRTGRADEARSHHLAGYRRVRGNTGLQDEVGLHLEFCALSRNEGRGLEILAENRSLFEATGAPLAHLGFLTGVEVLMARLVKEGHAETAVAGPPGRTWSAGELHAHVNAEAAGLASAFDTRNGTTAVGDLRDSRLARRPLVDEPLPLGLRTRTPRASGVKESAPKAPVVDLPEDFVSLVREARRLSSEGHPADTRAWTRVDERLAEDPDTDGAHDDRLGPEDLLRAELAEHRAAQLGRKRGTEAVAELERAAELFEGVGMAWHALAAHARTLAWRTDFETSEEDREALRARLDEALARAERLKTTAPFTGEAGGAAEIASGDDVGKQRVLAYLTVLNACAYAAYEDVEQQLPEPSEAAVERFEERVRILRAEAESHSMPHQLARARQYAADLAGRRGDLARAEAELRAAIEDVEASGRPWGGSRPRALLAQLLMAKEEWAEATELLHEAIAIAVRHDESDFPLAPTYALLGHAASHSGDSAGAVRHLSEAASRYDLDGVHDEAAETRLQLADVLARGGQQADAVAVLESVLADETVTALDPRALAQARLTLARGLRELDEYLPAAEEFLRLADVVAAWEDDRQVHTLVAAEAASTLAMAGRWDAAASAYDRAVASHAEAPNSPVIITMMCDFARLTMRSREAEGVDAALDHLAQADAVLAAVPEDTEDFARWYESGSVHYRRACVLAEAERYSEALSEAEASIAAHDEGGEYGEIPRAESVRLAALVEGKGLGRPNDAIVRLTAAVARCRGAGLDEPAHILDALRQQYMGR
ncbi:hypothetical protein [Streptomyces sp. NPDC001927]